MVGGGGGGGIKIRLFHCHNLNYTNVWEALKSTWISLVFRYLLPYIVRAQVQFHPVALTYLHLADKKYTSHHRTPTLNIFPE